MKIFIQAEHDQHDRQLRHWIFLSLPFVICGHCGCHLVLLVPFQCLEPLKLSNHWLPFIATNMNCYKFIRFQSLRDNCLAF